MAKAKITGTREWATHNVNCITGCSNNCRYCYARANAVRFKQVESPDYWSTMRVREHDVVKKRTKLKGRVMFPTTHDITPETMGPCTAVLANLLEAGNEVLIVSKPHLRCIKELCSTLRDYRPQITWRFSIGSRHDEILGYWEPGAPSYEERFKSLQHANRAGYETSVSCEPLLDCLDAPTLVAGLEPWVTDSIWIGPMNKIRNRVATGTSSVAIANILAGQEQHMIEWLYAELKDEPKVRWKDAYKKALGLTLAAKAGQDE